MLKRKKFILVVLVFGALLFGGWEVLTSSKQTERNQKIEKEVATLENEAEKIRRENETLREKIIYFASDDFREQEAKRKLGLKRSDETMVVIRPGAVYDGSEAGGAVYSDATVVAGESPSRIMKWLNVFFGAR
jgi:cell division protein FtsB